MFKFSCSYKDTSHIKWQPPILSDLILTWLYLQKLFPNKVTFRGTRSQDFNIYFLGDIIQSITEENWKTIIWGLKSYVDIHMEILKMYILWLSVPLLRIYPKEVIRDNNTVSWRGMLVTVLFRSNILGTIQKVQHRQCRTSRCIASIKTSQGVRGLFCNHQGLLRVRVSQWLTTQSPDLKHFSPNLANY